MLSCIWKKLQLFTALPACSKIARTNVKVGKTRLLALVQLRAQEQAFNWLLVGWAMIRIPFRIGYTTMEWRNWLVTGRKHQLYIRKPQVILGEGGAHPCTLPLDPPLFWCFSSNNSLGWLCLFRYVFCRNLAKLTIFAHFYTTVVNDGLHEPDLLRIADK